MMEVGGFWDETEDFLGGFATWEDARTIFMMYLLDKHGVGDQDLLYVDVEKTVSISRR